MGKTPVKSNIKLNQKLYKLSDKDIVHEDVGFQMSSERQGGRVEGVIYKVRETEAGCQIFVYFHRDSRHRERGGSHSPELQCQCTLQLHHCCGILMSPVWPCRTQPPRHPTPPPLHTHTHTLKTNQEVTKTMQKTACSKKARESFTFHRFTFN